MTKATLVVGVTFAAPTTPSAFAAKKGDPGKDKKIQRKKMALFESHLIINE